jgi:mRNA-degrading endonuclease toxin of MazEF toxin-antitoxin module
VLIDVSTAEGKQTGLQFDSVVNCVNLATLDKNRVLRKLGVLPATPMQAVNEALKAALDLS